MDKPEALRLADELDGISLADMTEAMADEAAAELRRLHGVNAELLGELQNIANANPRKWDAEFRDQFQNWAQNRARAAIAKAEEQK